jgi:hypothetical protein
MKLLNAIAGDRRRTRRPAMAADRRVKSAFISGSSTVAFLETVDQPADHTGNDLESLLERDRVGL